MHLGIIGAGLIGGSIARAARDHKAADRITVIEANEANARKAFDLGLGDECGTDAMLLADCDLVILATSSAYFDAIGRQIAPHLKKGAIVSDVASVKGQAIAALKPHIPAHAHFIPAHPIAGTENSGLESGFPELFKNKYLIITPMDDTKTTPLGTLTHFWEGLGAHVATMTPESHDAAFATTSHLPHAIAFSLMQAARDQAGVQGAEILQFSASSFGDYTRVAGSDPALWADIFMANRDQLLASIAAYNAKLAQVTHLLHTGDRAGLERFIGQSRDGRRTLEAFKEQGVKGF